MGTLVCFHAHPDDEAMTTGGTMARAAAEGHRVVLVVATNGEHGESPDDLAAGETLVDRRRARDGTSRRTALGVHRVVWLGYHDSGMTGWEQNADPDELPAGRRRRGRRPARRRPARGGRRRAHDLRLARQLRPSRPHPGPPRRRTVPPSRGRRRPTSGVRGDDEPRRDRGDGRPGGRGGRWRSAPRTRSSTRTDRPTTAIRSACPRPSCTHEVDVSAYVTAKRSRDRQPPQPGHRHRLLPRRCPRRCSPPGSAREWFIERGVASPGCVPSRRWLFDGTDA